MSALKYAERRLGVQASSVPVYEEMRILAMGVCAGAVCLPLEGRIPLVRRPLWRGCAEKVGAKNEKGSACSPLCAEKRLVSGVRGTAPPASDG